MYPITKSDLIALNELYHHLHTVSDRDVDTANIYRLAVERSRSPRVNVPAIGDLVSIDGKGLARVDSIEGDSAIIVRNPYTPFISCKWHDSYPRISLSISGGPFESIPLKKFVFDREQFADFCFFGSYGPCANGAVDFQALVNLFRIKK